MELTKITNLVTQLGISSRSLRYYEQAGLIQSVRPNSEKYRFYDEENVERLKQIMLLRKMEIPIKDILRIYESTDMSVVVETFINRIRAIDEEVGALTELRAVVNDFLSAMLQNGVTKISALPILYEQMEKRLDTWENVKTMDYQELSALSERVAEPVNPSIIELPSMRILSSGADTEGFWRWLQSKGIPNGRPGMHEQFECQDEILLCVADDFTNDSVYQDRIFDGGLYAAANIYLDEDLGQRFRVLVSCFDDNKFYEVDYSRDSMLENLLSPDDKRELVSLLVPVKKRMADPALFDKSIEVTDISIEEIEAANTALWAKEVPLDKLTPINRPYYQVSEQGEAEYIAWISTRVLSTNVAVKLPFRVDVEFRIRKESMQFAWGADEGSIRLYHGGDLNFLFGINMETNPDERLSQEAICFHQPIFRDFFRYPKRGQINRNEYNRLTWIVGKKHLAVIINDEIRYCGVNFPYMSMNLGNQESLPIIIGSNGQSRIFFKSIRVSQLVETKKNILKEGELTMVTRQSNNIIPVIHRLVTDEYGENYWFNGCAKYVMECLGEKDYDYWFFAGVTGDVFTQHYSYTNYSGEAVSSYLLEESPVQFVEDTFSKCGYSATYVSSVEVLKNNEMYLNTLIAYIDKGVPVIAWGRHVGVYVGYEEYGKVLLLITGNSDQPERIPLDKAFETQPFHGYEHASGWIFVGDKKENRPLAEIYRKAIKDILPLQSVKTDSYCFGPEAFMAWASDVENGKFSKMTVEEFDIWCDYTNYVCVLATNGSCAHNFLKKAQGLNPDMTFLEDIGKLYDRMAKIWNNDNGGDLEALGGGFNVTLEALQNKEKSSKIAAKLRECVECVDEIIRIVNLWLD